MIIISNIVATLPLTGGTLTGDLLFSLDNTHNIGAVGATRPAIVYAGTSMIAPLFNAATGFQIGGAAATPGHVLRANGTNYVDAQLDYGDLSGTPAAALPLTGGTLTGDLLFSLDNTHDIGASGATRPRTIYVGTSVLAPLFNAATGFQIAGAATSGNYLRGNGTNFVSSAIQAGDVPSLAYLPLAGGTLTGDLLFSLDNTKDIGASGATRPRTIYLGTSVITPDVQITGGTGNLELKWNASAVAYDLAGNVNAFRLGPFVTGAGALGQPGWQVFPNTYASATTLQGQMFFDCGSAATSAIIFREGQGGTIKERFKIALNGDVTFTKGTTGNGNILFTNDNVSNIGAVGATRPANIYAGASINAGTLVAAGTSITAVTTITAGTVLSGDTLKITGNASLPTDAQGSLYIGSGYASDSSVQIQLASDDFNRADGALGANWTDNAGAFKIVSNRAACNSTADAIEFNHYSAVSFINDQWAQATVTAVSGGGVYIGLSVRAASGSTKTGYVLYFNGATVFLSKMIAGSRTVFNGGSSIGTLAVNDVVLLTVQGSTLTVYKNGVSMFSVVDTAITSGSPGLGGFGTAGTSTIDNWSAGVFRTPLGRLYAGDGTGIYQFEIAKRVGSIDTVLFTFSDSGVLTLSNMVSSYVSKSGNYALVETDSAVVFTATATATLPASMPAGKTFRIKLKGASLTLTITPASGLIDDAANAILTVDNQAIDVVFDGTNWQIF